MSKKKMHEVSRKEKNNMNRELVCRGLHEAGNTMNGSLNCSMKEKIEELNQIRNELKQQKIR